MFTNGHTQGVMGYQAGRVRVSMGWVAILVALSLSATACSRLAGLKAMKTYKDANQAYQQQDYKRASLLYEEAIQNDPNLLIAYFYLGNSYDNLYKPGRKGEPENDQLLEKAVSNYQAAADKLSSDKPDESITRKRALQFLAEAYGADKLNDPSKAEPVIQRLIQLNPADPTNYFALGKLYEDAGVYDEAEKAYTWAKDAKPADPNVYLQLAGYYKRQGDFGKTIESVEQRAAREPNNPEAFQMIASYYWDETSKNATLADAQKIDYVQKGLKAVDQAIQLNSEYYDALVFKNLLLRLQANMEKDFGRQQALIKEADTLKAKAEGIKKQKTAGVGN